jgi:hypothetical protein
VPSATAWPQPGSAAAEDRPRSGRHGPATRAFLHAYRHFSHRQPAGVHAYVADGTGVQVRSLLQHLRQLLALTRSSGKPLRQLRSVSAQQAHRQRHVRELIDVHAMAGVDNAGNHHALSPGRPVTRNDGAEIAFLHPMPTGIGRGFRIAHTQLVMST